MQIARVARGTATVLLAGTLAVAATGTTASAGEGHGTNGKEGTTSQQSANNDCGEYCSTRDGSPSRNGNGHGESAGRPCAGCVGNADDKNPKGQYANGSDANNGYECDGNSGIARTNPAHTGCTASAPSGQGVEATPPASGPETAPGSPAAPAVDVPVVAPGTVEAPASAPDAATVVKGVGNDRAPEVLGVRLTRPVATPAGPQGTLPFTGGADTDELLLAGAALLVTGLVATRAGSRRRTA